MILLSAFVAAACAPLTAPAVDAGGGSDPSTVSRDVSPSSEAVTAVRAGDLPACTGIPTTANQEGPYYSPGSPERDNLVEDGMAGEQVTIVGRVYDEACNPLAGAKLDFWQADFDGVYDNRGYTLRGHLFTDENGAYALQTIEPGPYTGRPPHIHVKVFAPDGRELLTSQIYTSGSEESRDVAAAPDLLAAYLAPDDQGRKQVLFDFVVNHE